MSLLDTFQRRGIVEGFFGTAMEHETARSDV